jgi:copper oxidase (laccase) domain-containing protein
VRSFEVALDGLAGAVVVTTRAAGDLRPAHAGSEERRQAAVPGRRWSWTRQVHGATVLFLEQAGESGDALVASPAHRPAMFAADCALIGLLSREGIAAAVHAGWRGLLAGVVEATAEKMRAAGAGDLFAVRGPCIGPECYEFGSEDLDRVAGRYGPAVRSETSTGRPALDLAAGIRLACERAGVDVAHEVRSCTACATASDGSYLWFSHRARKEAGRHALVVTEGA